MEIINTEVESVDNILLVAARIADPEIQIYMNACDCVIMPYKTFTTSGVAVLAMSFGRVCIAPNVGFFADILDSENAYLYSECLEDEKSYC